MTKEDVSHCAIELPTGVILHSNFRGLRLQSSRLFRRDNEIIYEIPIFTDISVQKQRLNDLFDKYEFSLYDVGALFFLAYH